MTTDARYGGAGFAAPQVFPGGPVDAGEIRAVVLKAESLGYDSIWTQEQVVGQSRSLEPVSLLSYLAGITRRVRLGVAVLVLPLHNPVHLAKALASLDVLSDGRLTVGVGLGSVNADINAALGIPADRRIRRFTEALLAMDALWTEDWASFQGELFQLRDTPMQPKPVQKPRPPVWFGGRAEQALRRAVRYADGWMGAGSSSAEDFRRHVEAVRRFLDEAGRDPETFTISKRVYVAIDDDAVRAERRLRDWFGHHYGNPGLATQVSIWGPWEQCYARIDELIEAGAQHLLLNPVFDYDEHLEALARYAGGTP